MALLWKTQAWSTLLQQGYRCGQRFLLIVGQPRPPVAEFIGILNIPVHE